MTKKKNIAAYHPEATNASHKTEPWAGAGADCRREILEFLPLWIMCSLEAQNLFGIDSTNNMTLQALDADRNTP